jgi:predicted O-linked N-acetylglucosamine transferase (SPINDLY family)
VELALDPERLAGLRSRLANRLTFPLFDIRRYVRNIEAAYETMFRRCQEGLQPTSIDLTGNFDR